MSPKDEIEDAYLTIGICIRSKINELCNIHRFDDAFELENAYKIINKYTNNALEWKENKQDILNQIAEEQKTLLDSTKAWSNYIDKNGNIY